MKQTNKNYIDISNYQFNQNPKKQQITVNFFQNILREDEQLKRIYGYGGKYYISNYGEIYSIYSNKKLQKYNDKGYYTVGLYENGKKHTIRINQITALYWCDNDNPMKKTIVHHKDFNSLNNKANNLQWVSFDEHMKIHSKAGAEDEPI